MPGYFGGEPFSGRVNDSPAAYFPNGEPLDSGRFKMNPPLRSEDDREALREGVFDRTIDMIATDHAPHSAEEKSRGLEKSAMGVVGLETAFPVLYTELVKPGILSLEKLVELLSVTPRTRFGIPMREDEWCAWNITDATRVDPEQFLTMGKASPFTGREVLGTCLVTTYGGKTVWQIK